MIDAILNPGLPGALVAIVFGGVFWLTYALTIAAVHAGPNRAIGFRLSPRIQEPQAWDAVHRGLLPLQRTHALRGTVLAVATAIASVYLWAFLIAFAALVVMLFASLAVQIAASFRLLDAAQ